MLELTTEIDKADIELEFGDVNTKYRFCHGGELLV
jgi:hypothetical protein